MFEPIFPLLGVPPDLQLLDPLTVFTPLTAALVALCSLLSIVLTMCLARVDARRRRDTPRSATTPSLPKAA
jgi:hypothetical protein